MKRECLEFSKGENKETRYERYVWWNIIVPFEDFSRRVKSINVNNEEM